MQTGELCCSFNRYASFVFQAWRQEHHAKPKFCRQVDSRFARLLSYEILWDRGEQSCAITAYSIRIHTAAMREAHKRSEGALHHLARARAAQSGDEAYTTCVVVDGRVDQSKLPRVSNLSLLTCDVRESTIVNFNYPY
jgi:hypothetical protein